MSAFHVPNFCETFSADLWVDQLSGTALTSFTVLKGAVTLPKSLLFAMSRMPRCGREQLRIVASWILLISPIARPVVSGRSALPTFWRDTLARVGSTQWVWLSCRRRHYQMTLRQETLV